MMLNNKNIKSNSAYKFINLGIPSLLMLFVIICLLIFSFLSLSTVNADLRLSQKSKDFTLHFYKADTASELLLSRIDFVLKENKDSDLNNLKNKLENIDPNILITEEQGELLINYTIPLDNNTHDLKVTLKTCLSLSGTGRNYDIISYSLMNTSALSDDWEDNDLNLLITP